ncbi:DUF485 domain-containing protein [Streptomyces sp. TRM43335]|uniref:DUF485 domain-containing protein n=1 Tax=Streptomyces taklimakanensis TaxID=2569853 RepID=A0A6G2BHH7_9ACTN|nr:DUF485 domain-containing protein [Streptomyces taklimakanensis]MTE21352.1 DUF485 domain-containing protein [Streptomyces taklimakanensis]
MRIDDPWHDTLASGRGEGDGGLPAPGPGVETARTRSNGGAGSHADARAAARTAARLAVHRSAAFEEMRRRHRRFVLPAAGCLLLGHLAYAVASVAAPGLMARAPGGGPLTVGTLAALAQPVIALVVVRAYLGHARLHRDGTALELRWYAQDLARSADRRASGAPGAREPGEPVR